LAWGFALPVLLFCATLRTVLVIAGLRRTD
jgi:hypothetical protein